MEHEVFVPVAPEILRQTLADPGRVARCVPGLQQNADTTAGPLAGRLRIRVAGHTITYRGSLRVTERGGGFAVEGEGTEARGSGSAKLALAIRLTPTGDGTTLTFTGTTMSQGRLAELPADAATATAHRLLDRFAESLTTAADETPGNGGGIKDNKPGEADETTGATAGIVDELDDLTDEVDELTDDVDEATPPPRPSVFDAPIPPSALDPLEDDDLGEPRIGLPAEPPAEAAHARRTMIGRSAEEVDHAPPRGRYAPVPAPDSGSAGATLRWMAPAAALALASAVVVGRALRRRR